MIFKKNFFKCPERRDAARIRIFACVAALGFASGVVIAPSAWATDSAVRASGPASDQLAVLEPASQLPDTLEPASAEPDAEQLESAPLIDLDYVQDLALVIEEARKQAQVEYLAKKLRQPPQTLQQYVQLAWAEASRRAGLRPELLLAIMHKESTFRPKVQSRYGAQGLMQVVRRWHGDKLDKNESLFDPEVNVRVGTDVLEEYLDWAEGDISKALAKYSGNARGYANKIIDESRKLAQVADTAAAQVALAPELFEPVAAEGDEPTLQAASERAG